LFYAFGRGSASGLLYGIRDGSAFLSGLVTGGAIVGAIVGEGDGAGLFPPLKVLFIDLWF
jgi:hypothetical protein